MLEIDAAFADDVARGQAGHRAPRLRPLARPRARVDRRGRGAAARVTTANGDAAACCCAASRRRSRNPLNVESRDLATPQSSGALVLFLIAFYGLFAAVMGGMAAALDTTAGERERAVARAAADDARARRWSSRPASGWPCRCSTPRRSSLTLSGFYLTLRFAPLPAVGIPFLFGLAELGRFVVVLVPLILLMPAILLYVGCRGRTFKEAQANLSVLLFVVSLLPIVQMFLQKKEPAWLTWVPVSGQYALLSRALRGEALPLARAAAVLRRPGAADARRRCWPWRGSSRASRCWREIVSCGQGTDARPRVRALAQLPDHRERRLPHRAARAEPAGERHGERAAADAVEPHHRIGRERDLEHAVGQHVADRRRAGGREQPGERAQHQELGDLRARRAARRDAPSVRRIAASNRRSSCVAAIAACSTSSPPSSVNRNTNSTALRHLLDDRLHLPHDLADVDREHVRVLLHQRRQPRRRLRAFGQRGPRRDRSAASPRARPARTA